MLPRAGRVRVKGPSALRSSTQQDPLACSCGEQTSSRPRPRQARRRWWNESRGRLARREIWLQRDQTWRVEARQGDGDSRVWSHDYPTEARARAADTDMINRAGGSSEWRELTTQWLPPWPAERCSSIRVATLC